ncbi:MAG TPA: hypothetical protein VFZ98_06750, partial [Vicinamibacterales bacterium]
MPHRPPAGAEIRDLIAALAAEHAVARESAVARLAVVGTRAVEPLLRAYASADVQLKAGILRAFEAMAEPRALGTARAALTSDTAGLHAPAAGVLRALLASSRSDAASAALDALVATAVDARLPKSVRLMALDALRDAPLDVLEPVTRSLGGDPDAEIRALVTGSADPRHATGIHDDVWTSALEGQLPASPEALKDAINARQTAARLTELQRLVDRIRAHERKEADPARREQWRVVRGTAHQALAARNSRLALYDLRDSLLEPERLPVAFLAAIEEIGDASCVEALAAAYETTSRSGDVWWRGHIAAAFRAIVRREGLT